MKLLHTSDWHLGRALYGRKRYDEYEALLNCLAALKERIGAQIRVIPEAGGRSSLSSPGCQRV